MIEDTIEENEELEDDLEVFVAEEVAEATLILLSENLDLSNNSNSLIICVFRIHCTSENSISHNWIKSSD